MNPFGSTGILWTITAVSLIVEALIDVITAFVGRRKTEESFRKQRNCAKDAVSYGK